MAGFVASEAVPGLDFDLTPYGPTGVVPEPSVAQVDALTDALREIFTTEGTAPNTDSTVALLTKLAETPEQEQQRMLDRLKDAMIGIIEAAITREQFDALPYRWQRSFQGWLLGALLAPEGSSPATTA